MKFPSFLVLTFTHFLVLYNRISLCESSIKGVKPSDLIRYQKNKNGTFQCFDNSKIIEFKEINDDYCDCLDGSDEPGTSACKTGRFYCSNINFKPSFIPSFLVNDGVCDPECCDGSDEYDGKIVCPNTCEIKGKEHRANEAEKLRTLQQGSKKKIALFKEGKQKFDAASKKLVNLESELAYIQNVISLKKYQVENAERLEKESEENQKKKGQLAPSAMAKQIHRLQETIHSLQDEIWAFRNTTKSEEDLQSYFKKIDEIFNEDLQIDLQPLPIVEEKAEEVPSTFLDRLKVSWNVLFKGNVLKALDLARKDTQLARTAYDEALQKETKLKEEKAELEGFLSLDVHKNLAFLTMTDSCYTLNIDKYTYTLCPFKKTLQISDGYEVSIGHWNGKWLDNSTWLFDNGQHCWNGPVRSTKVFLECGPKPQVIDAKETSRCLYEMKFQNPASCGEVNPEPEIPGNMRDGEL